MLWTERPHALTPADWLARLEAGAALSVLATESTRGLELIVHEAEQEGADAWRASVVPLTHRPVA